MREASDDAERALLWKGRKGAFAAMGRISPDYYVQDGVVPRTRLPEVLRRIAELSEQHGLRVGNVFHAGDGNLHPLVLYDAAATARPSARRKLAEAILAACLDAGGSLTGEHGVGVDKACAMPGMFSERDLEVFARLRRAFDPDGLANPGKVLPTPRLCGEVPGPYRDAPAREDRRCRASLAWPRRPRSWPQHAAETGRHVRSRRGRDARRHGDACSSTRRAT